MKITVNKCPHTGRLFEDDKEYRRHMDKIRLVKKNDAGRVAMMPHFDKFMESLYQLNTAESIAEWLSTNWLIYARHHGYRSALWGYDHIYELPDPETDKVIIEIESLKFSENINVFNQRPRGRQGSYKNDDGFNEYGWEGRIYINHHGNSYQFFSSNQLRDIGINTGSGGGGPKQSRYELKLFASDFPKLMAMEVYNKMCRTA